MTSGWFSPVRKWYHLLFHVMIASYFLISPLAASAKLVLEWNECRDSAWTLGFDLWTLSEACHAHPHRRNVKTQIFMAGWGAKGTPKGKVVLKREQERKRGWKITQKHCRNNYCEAIMRFDFGLLRLKYSIQEVHINDKHIWVWHSEHCGHELEQHGASSGFRWGLGGLSSADSAGTSCKLSGVNLKTLHPTQSSSVLRFMDVMLTKMECMFLFVCHHLKVKIHIDSRERLRCL